MYQLTWFVVCCCLFICFPQQFEFEEGWGWVGVKAEGLFF